jgi:hypothetical protein
MMIIAAILLATRLIRTVRGRLARSRRFGQTASAPALQRDEIARQHSCARPRHSGYDGLRLE